MLRGPEHHLLIFEGRNQNPAPLDLRKIEQDLRSLLDSYGVPIRMHTVQKENRNLHERYGAGSPILYLVRPDGHVAYRGPAEDPDGIGSYLDDMSGRKWERVEQGVSTQGAGRNRCARRVRSGCSPTPWRGGRLCHDYFVRDHFV